MTTKEIRASGGLIVRDGRVVVVHRAEYDDWSFPKGKADAGESDEDCALREIEEETGLRVELGEELATTTHLDARAAEAGALVADDAALRGVHADEEVDELLWLTLNQARAILTYSRDVELLESISLTRPAAEQ